MYPNLRAEAARKKMSFGTLAEKIGIAKSSMFNKLNGTYHFTLEEAEKIRQALDVDIPLDVLFEREEA